MTMVWRPGEDYGQWWGRAARDWAELQEPLALPLWVAMLNAASVGPGTRLLDAGCGAGGASVLAAGRGALVNGLDAAEALLTIARERVPDGDFLAGDLAALPYEDGIFDAVLAADVLAYVVDAAAVVGELRRVCATGGCLVASTWSGPEACVQHVIAAAIRALLPAQPAGAALLPLGDALSAPGNLDALLAQAGLRVHAEGTVVCPYDYPDAELLWQAQAAAGPVQAALRVVGAEPLKAVVLGAVAPYRTVIGGVRLPNCFRYVAATPHKRDAATRT
jgi:SAM-dependent methyltransferase